jgi:hypothetical protein
MSWEDAVVHLSADDCAAYWKENVRCQPERRLKRRWLRVQEFWYCPQCGREWPVKKRKAR